MTVSEYFSGWRRLRQPIDRFIVDVAVRSYYESYVRVNYARSISQVVDSRSGLIIVASRHR